MDCAEYLVSTECLLAVGGYGAAYGDDPWLVLLQRRSGELLAVGRYTGPAPFCLMIIERWPAAQTDLVEQIVDSGHYHCIAPELSNENVNEAWENYFVDFCNMVGCREQSSDSPVEDGA